MKRMLASMNNKKLHNAMVKILPRDELFDISNMTRPTKAYISLDNLESNLLAFYGHLKNHCSDEPQLLPIVKANGYGHGALPLTLQALQVQEKQNKVIAGVAVATLEEAIMLRQQLNNLNVTCPLLLLLGALPKGSEDLVVQYEITPSICTASSLTRFIKASTNSEKRPKFHLKLDTGMHRVGFSETELEQVMPDLRDAVASGIIEVDGVYTHLSKADEVDKDYTIQQLKCFQQGIDFLRENNIPIRFVHSMNSAGSIDFEKLSNELPFLKDLNLYRIGISLYGLYPSNDVDKPSVPLRPLMKWTSEIVQLKSLSANKKIGYGGTYETTGNTKIAVLPVGYADGYRRLLGANETNDAFFVSIKGQKCPIVGRVCMDMIMVDVSHVEDVAEGDEALLMGENEDNLELHCDVMAKRLATINYEITCLVGERVPRFYYKDGKLVGTSTLYSTAIAEEWNLRHE